MEELRSQPMAACEPEICPADSALWSWYVSNLKQGTFEQIIANEKRFQQIRRTSAASAVKLIVSVPECLLLQAPAETHWHEIVAEKFQQYLPDPQFQQLDGVTATNERLFIIDDDENRFVYKFRIDLIRNNLLPMLRPQVTQPLSPPTSGDEQQQQEGEEEQEDEEVGLRVGVNDQFKRDLVHVVEEYEDSIVTDTDTGDDDEEVRGVSEQDYSDEDADDDDSDTGAITFNFARKGRGHICRKRSPMHVEKETLFSPVDSEVLSINSFDNSFGMDADVPRCGDTAEDDDFLSLRKIAANNTNSSNVDRTAFTVTSAKDLDLKLVAAVCRDEREPSSFSTAIRQEMGEDWVIYDENFSLDNLEYCSMDEVLYGDRQVTTLLFSLVPFAS